MKETNNRLQNVEKKIKKNGCRRASVACNQLDQKRTLFFLLMFYKTYKESMNGASLYEVE